MYWRREFVIWNQGARLLGKQSGAASAVNFAEQRGIYLLHDRDRVIYVGRADDTLFARLKAHVTDRLGGRWDRFSWFGLRAVEADGRLSEVVLDWTHDVVIETLEAMLIESLEPPLNRRRGDNLSAIEYSQVEDPDLEMRRRQELAARILGEQ
jgi:excinuclease UvrABC nuclease subunit